MISQWAKEKNLIQLENKIL